MVLAFLVVALGYAVFQATAASAVPIQLLDDAGPDDEPGQKDLNSLIVDSSPATPGTLEVAWNWDFGPGDLSGGNTADACSLIDTDGDGLANYSLCVTWGDDGSGTNTYLKTSLYSCGNTRADRCTNPRPLIAEDTDGDGDLEAIVGGPYASSCSLTFGTTDPFGPRGGAQASDTIDTTASCTIVLADFGSATASLINVCSYPSEVPGSDPSDCVITPNRGFLTIVKVANPDDGTNFMFSIDPDATLVAGSQGNPDIQGPSEFTISGSGTEALIAANAGTWDLTEVVPAGWGLDSASCILGGGAATGTLDGATIEAVEIQSGVETTCTFNNALDQGTLTLNKVVVNDNGGTEFASAWTLTATDSNGAAVVTGNGTASGPVEAGDYDLSESGPSDYAASDWLCDAGQVDADTVTVVPGADITCEITNDDIAPTLTLVKNVVNDDGGTRIASEWALDTGGFVDQAGTYTISESGPADYELTSIVCDNGQQTTAAATLDVTLGLNDDITCTFTNDDIAPELTVIKVIVNDDGGTITDESIFTMNVANNGSTTSFPGAAAPGTMASVVVGSYDVTETNPFPNFYAVSYSADCTGTLALGDSKTCTVTNDDIAVNQPSIALTAPDISDGADGSKFVGTTTITNESDGLDPAEILVSSFNITVEVQQGKGKNRTWVPVAVMCTTDPAVPFTFGPDPQDLTFSCMTADGSDLKGRHRITIEAQIFNRPQVFTERAVVRF